MQSNKQQPSGARLRLATNSVAARRYACPIWTSESKKGREGVGTAAQLVQELRADLVRAEGDYSNDKINGKIQQAEQAKVHTMLVVGPRDLAANAVSVRVHGKGSLGAKPKAEVVADILAAIRERRA